MTKPESLQSQMTHAETVSNQGPTVAPKTKEFRLNPARRTLETCFFHEEKQRLTVPKQVTQQIVLVRPFRKNLLAPGSAGGKVAQI